MKQSQRKQIEQQWERAIEQAQENQPRDPEFDKQELNNAAGLHIQSGVKVGSWLSTYTQNFTCGCTN